MELGRITKAIVLIALLPSIVWGQMPILPGILNPAAVGYVSPTLNAYAYAFQGSTTTSVATNAATVNSGVISVAAGDLIVSEGQATFGTNSAITLSMSPASTFTQEPYPTQTSAASFGGLGYATASSSSSSAYFTTGVAATQTALGNLTLDFICPTCGTPAYVNCNIVSGSTLTCPGLTLTAGTHGILGVFCASSGNNTHTWTIGTIAGTAATAMKTSSATAGTGALACEYLYQSSGSYSSASAVLTLPTSPGIATGTFIAWPVNG